MCAWQKKRKAAEVGNGEYTEATMVPTWVVCENTFKLWTVGEKPAPEASLSPQAVAEVARLKAWAAGQRREPEEEEPRHARGQTTSGNQQLRANQVQRLPWRLPCRRCMQP